MEMTVLINVIIHTPSNDYKPYTTFNGSDCINKCNNKHTK